MSRQFTEVQRFQIEQFEYELQLQAPGPVMLSLVGGRVPGIGDIRQAYREYDPFEKWEDYDPDDFFLDDDYDFGVNSFALMRECINRVSGWANRVRPGYFTFTSSTDRKIRVYQRIAKIIGSKINSYSYQPIQDAHVFYRIAKTPRTINRWARHCKSPTVVAGH